MAAYFASKSRILAALKDEGGLFEIRFLQRLLGREQAGVARAHASAVQVQDGVADLRQFVLRETATDDNSPNILDADERAELLTRLGRVGTTARHTTGTLEQLT